MSDSRHNTSIVVLSLASVIYLAAGLLRAGPSAEAPTPILSQAAIPRVIVADDTFAYAPSGVTGSAIWVAEYITKACLEGDGNRPAHFHVDQQIPPGLRATERDYTLSGFARFHLAPVADVGNQEAMFRRMGLSNVSPGSPGLNSGKWEKIERIVRTMVDDDTDLFVITAAAYELHSHPVRVAGSVIVPTHFVKAVLVLRASEPVSMRCWIVTNQQPPAIATTDSFLATVDEAESLTQLDFFPFLDDEQEARLEAGR